MVVFLQDWFGCVEKQHNSVVTLGVGKKARNRADNLGAAPKKEWSKARQRRAPRCTKAWNVRFTVWF
jgi:hypothetical protein